MATMQKGNKQVRVTEEKVEEFLKMGYSEVGKEGEILQAGQATDLKDVKAENETLKTELAKYQSINLEAIKVENTTLKEGLDILNSKYENIEKENEALKSELETLKSDKKAK